MHFSFQRGSSISSQWLRVGLTSWGLIADGNFRLQEWVKDYGDIFSLKIGSGNMIVISSADIVLEYVEKDC
jgi:hypothetical protein